MIFRSLVAALCVASLSLQPRCAWASDATPAASVEPANALRSQLRIVLAQGSDLDPRAKLVTREGAEAERDSNGLAVKIAPGAGKYVEAGVSADLPLRGDFEVTAEYELVSVDQPAVGIGAGISLALAGEKPEKGVAAEIAFSRVLSPSGSNAFTVEHITGGTSDNRQQLNMPAKTNRGRLRVSRSGKVLRYQAAEGESGEFRDVGSGEFASDVIRDVRFVAHNGNSTAGIHARLIELTLRAARLAPPGPSLLLIDGSQVPGRPIALTDRQLVVKSGDTTRSIALDEVVSIELQPSEVSNPPKTKPSAENKEGEKGNQEARYTVHLDRQDVISGELREITDTAIRLKPVWGPIDVPLLAARGFISASASESDQSAYLAKIKAPDNQDALLVKDKSGKTSTIGGTVQRLADGKLHVDYEGQQRAINQARLVAVVFAARPPVPPSLEPFQVFRLRSGERLSGHLMAVTDHDFEIDLAAGAHCRLPEAQVDQIVCRNGKLIYLSDIEPVLVEETGYFGQGVPYHRDQSLNGGPLVIAGRVFEKGLAVRARSVLVYQIDGGFATFRATVGFDPAAGGGGRIRGRVLGDGQELFANADLTAAAGATEIEVSLAGVRRLTLEADFGLDEDVGDHFIWGGARIYRGDADRGKTASR